MTNPWFRRTFHSFRLAAAPDRLGVANHRPATRPRGLHLWSGCWPETWRRGRRGRSTAIGDVDVRLQRLRGGSGRSGRSCFASLIGCESRGRTPHQWVSGSFHENLSFFLKGSLEVLPVFIRNTHLERVASNPSSASKRPLRSSHSQTKSGPASPCKRPCLW